MRMRLRRLHRDESGAVLIIVALSLIAMVGFSALVIDVGGLLVTRRVMVKASDSAALAAAQSCATGTRADADQKADHYASRNQASYDTEAVTGGIVDSAGCGTEASGSVTVTYEVPQKTYFTSLLGLPTSFDVPASATGIWGPAGSGSLPPLMVSASAFQGDCDIPGQTAQPGAECNLWYSNDTLGSSTWGWLNLYTEDDPGPGGAVGWNVDPAAKCPSVAASQREEWLQNPVAVPAINYEDPTYVCVVDGLTDSNWEALRDLIPIELQFPVNDPETQVDKDGNVVSEKPHKYNVIGFVTLYVTALYDGNSSEALGTAGSSYEVACTGQPTPQPHTFQTTAADWDISSWVNDCAAAHPADTISVKVDQSKYKPGEHFTYSNGVITWLKFPKSGSKAGKVEDATFTIFRSGSTAGSAGACGSGGKAPDGSTGKLQDKCLVTEWVGYTTNGGDPGQGADFGNRPVRLSE